jgi:hypothetical protein
VAEATRNGVRMLSVLYTSSRLGRVSTSDAVDPTFPPAAGRLGRSARPCSVGRSNRETLEQLAVASLFGRQSRLVASVANVGAACCRYNCNRRSGSRGGGGAGDLDLPKYAARRQRPERRGCEGKSERGGEADSEGRAAEGSGDGGRGCS